ncbi:hypothetical protein B0H11DRAFT_2317460 [Mycena galericulata]|nr:hypothetical protein B0H11DRAFT_2317460 [Mycena galericulata]
MSILSMLILRCALGAHAPEANSYPSTGCSTRSCLVRLPIAAHPLFSILKQDRTLPVQNYTCRYGTHSVTAIKAKPAPFLHNTVRHLLLDYVDKPWSQEEARDVLKLCTAVVDFAVVSYFTDPALLPILAEMHVERLSVSLQELSGDDLYIDLHHHLFAFVTHLDIFDTIGDREAYIFPHIPALPALTHLGMSEIPWSSVEKLLTDCAKLELFVLLWPYRSASHGFEWMKNPPIRDVRLVAALYIAHWDDWENGAQGRGNFWSAADTFVAGKRRREIDSMHLTSLIRQS